jgi:carboxypeptidase Taq
MTSAEHPDFVALGEWMAELSDLRAISGLLSWDRSTVMPSAGAGVRGHQAATLERMAHAKLTDPELARLLDRVEPWAAGLDPDSDEARTVAAVRQDFEKARRVPDVLAADMARAETTGEQAWMAARASGDFGAFRDALALHIDLRHRYVACFDDYEHPYDVLLDDYEPGLRLSEVRPLMAELRAALVPLVARMAELGPVPEAGVLRGTFPAGRQRDVMRAVLSALGFDDASWRLDPSEHPFAQAQSPQDVRITTLYDEENLGVALYSVLHEFGHGLYESQVSPRYARTPLGELVSLGLHESQSRLWENVIGRSRPFSGWLAPQLSAAFPTSLGDLTPDALYRGVNAVEPSLIRIFADETTYNLHIVLRTELEASLIDGTLEVDQLPAAWNEGMHRLLGIEVPDDNHGVLQDIHWSVGLLGYFPTYTIGNLMSAQLWERARLDLPDVEASLAGGEFAAVREWLRDNVHRHGRKYSPRELLRRVTGEDLRVEPLIAYLGDKLADVRALPTA